jgi:hypothetical protein
MVKKGTKKSSRRSSAMAAPLMLPMSMPDDSSSDSSSRYIWGAVLLVIVAIAVVVATQPGPFGLGTTTSAPTTQAAGILAGLGGGGMSAGKIAGIVVGVFVLVFLLGALGVFGNRKYSEREARAAWHVVSERSRNAPAELAARMPNSRSTKNPLYTGDVVDNDEEMERPGH